MNRADLNHRFAAVRPPLVVAAEPAAPHKLGEGLLDDPSLRRQHEALRPLAKRGADHVSSLLVANVVSIARNRVHTIDETDPALVTDACAT